MPFRARLISVGLPAVAAAVLLSGCTGLDEASAAGIARNDLISETAAQLSRVTDLTYTAKYQLTDGESATVTQAQRPTRTAYDFPGGRLIRTAKGTINCDKAWTCTQTDPTPVLPEPLPGTALVTPEAALAMLNTAALDQDVTATRRDTTIVGRPASCLQLAKVDGTPTSEFSLCVTNEGAMASFAATIDGKRIDQALTAYAEKVDTSTFTLPATAKLTDKRTR
ncbi:hypothetical protein [Paractinoplanes rishiriensis]|uniref:hypothetical protein n=1 Tax=Paractinoplanes rishiriensis TaxID=1050105 RepID=UPI0019406DA8|nr:hypothetical protein [Actinoplanes rishiriensis]